LFYSTRTVFAMLSKGGYPLEREINEMSERIVARWQDWSGAGLEHLVLREGAAGIVADSAILAKLDDEMIAVRYRIECDSIWRAAKAEIAQIGDDRAVELASDGVGNWVDGAGIAQPQLRGAIDIDISVTPFTNTLPIRRLGLKPGQTAEILAVYVKLPSLEIITDRQRYTCFDDHRYRYESVDSDFTRDIEVDSHGLVTTYPGLFRRVF
jgi:uncharacterized protein